MNPLRKRDAAVALLAIAGITLPSVADAGGGAVGVDFDPADQTVFVGDLVEINLIVQAEGAGPEPFAALDAILDWDPGFLLLLGVDDSNAGATFFISGFLPDPDGINDSLADGDAIYTALAPPGAPVDAPPAPDDLIVTTFQFAALAPTPETLLAFTPASGRFGQTRVLINGVDITGTIGGPAAVEILPADGGACCFGDGSCLFLTESACDTAGGSWAGPDTDCADNDDDGFADACDPCRWDLDNDGDVGPADLATLLAAWGPNPGSPADFNGNDDVGPEDLAKLLAQWGPCPI